MVFSELMIVADHSGHLFTIDTRWDRQSSPNLTETAEEPASNVEHMQVGGPILGIAHPRTYLNKILVFSKHSMSLVNIVSRKVLFEYPMSTILEAADIVSVVSCPLIDIVAITLSSGEICIFNIRKSALVFKMKQKRTVTCLGFSEDAPYMASADSLGNVILWDL